VKTVRERLLDVVRTQRTTTAAELARLMQMTEANARHHLAILKAQGLVQIAGQRQAAGKGRPTLVYSLSEVAAGHNLAGLASAIMDELDFCLEGDERSEVLKRVAIRMCTDNGRPAMPVATSLTQRLYQAVQRLNEMHYQARWEARSSSPRIILEHCPYAAILHNRSPVCQMDANLLGELVGMEVEQVARQIPGTRGSPYCVFRLTVSRV
jgi:predicted ArsR family transcriptional regulator